MPPTRKQSVRAARRARRRDIVAARDLARDDLALARGLSPLLAEMGIGPGDVVTSYESLPSEPPTGGLGDLIEARGARVIVPITLPDYDLDWTQRGDAGRQSLGPGAMAGARLVLVPALAVDATGTRMGQAGGCYDRALPRADPEALIVAILHPGEFVPEGSDPPRLPRDPWDHPVHAVLTAESLTLLPGARRPPSGLPE